MGSPSMTALEDNQPLRFELGGVAAFKLHRDLPGVYTDVYGKVLM